ncbi:MAG: MBL fold metallo-hydrolase [Candidatus Thorarchaeota archaeon]
MSVVTVAPDIHVVVGGMMPRCNTVVISGDELVVIDPGCAIEDLRMFLQRQGLELRNIDTVIITHIHPDHIVHAARLQRLSRCRIAANEITAPLFNDKEKMKSFLGFPPSNPVRPLWEKYIEEHCYGVFDDASVGEVLHNGDRLSLGTVTLRCVYTPGHTPDHMCIELEEVNGVYAVDIDCTEFGPFYGHPNSSIKQFRESIRLLKNRNYAVFISGHRQDAVVPDYHSSLAAYERQFDVREDLVFAQIMDGAVTVEDIMGTPIVYPSLSSPVFLEFERWMIRHHVDHLLEKGLVEEVNGKIRLP